MKAPHCHIPKGDERIWLAFSVKEQRKSYFGSELCRMRAGQQKEYWIFADSRPDYPRLDPRITRAIDPDGRVADARVYALEP